MAKTAEVLCERWTPLILRELMCGSTRFGEIHRGVPLASPTLLSSRLRHLVRAGVVVRTVEGRTPIYQLTPAGWELFPIIEAMGIWGQRWVRSDYTAEELDPTYLMWDIRRMVAPGGLARGQCVVEFLIRGVPARQRSYWMVVEPDAVDLCLVDPGKDIDLHVDADLRSLTQVWMGDSTFSREVDAGRIRIVGPPALVVRFPVWLGRHSRLGHVAAAR